MLKLNVKKVAKIFGYVVLAVVVLLFLLLIWTKRKIDNGEIVKWNGKWMTHEEFHKLTDSVQSKNTPQEAYTIFRQALLANDLEKALGVIRVDNRETYRVTFEDKVKLDSLVKKLPKKITLRISYERIDYYDVDMGMKERNTATFVKNEDDYWEIDQIY